VTYGTAAGATEIGGIGNSGVSGAYSGGLFQGGSPYLTDFTREALFKGKDASGYLGLADMTAATPPTSAMRAPPASGPGSGRGCRARTDGLPKKGPSEDHLMHCVAKMPQSD